MVDHNQKLLQELQKKSGNNVCADCGSPGMWLYVIIFIFECDRVSLERGIFMG